MHNVSEVIEAKAANHSSSVSQQNLLDFRSTYNIPRDHELIQPLPQERANTPLPGYLTMYEEHLKSSIALPLLRSVIGILHLWNLTLAQVHSILSRQLVGFIILCGALGIPASANIFRYHFCIRAPETNSDWFSCASKPGKGLFATRPISIKL